MEVFLLLNGFEIRSSVNEQERIVLQVAAGEIDREAFMLAFAIMASHSPEGARLTIRFSPSLSASVSWKERQN